ncbi:MAG: hypothetical protein KF716_08860 [Anaerolineae bacterium]|nr:hypothetical protein [Anaerolineae bacterium]
MGFNRQMALAEAVSSITERWGTAVLRQPQTYLNRDVPVISTGFSALDRALCIGGIPRGHITHLIGTPTSGMMTLAFKIVAQAHKVGDFAVFVDVGAAFDADYAKRCAVDLARMLIVRPPLEQRCNVLDIVNTLARSGGAGVIVVDASHHGISEIGNREALNRLTSQLSFSPCALLILTRGDTSTPSTTLIHQTALRLKLQRQRWLKRRQDIQGYRTKVEVLRNRFGAPTTINLTIGFSGVVAGDGV